MKKYENIYEQIIVFKILLLWINLISIKFYQIS